MTFKDQVKSSVDIVKVIGDYVRLRRIGSTGRYLGLCPFHQEKTPSFNVVQTSQFYKCFGCGAGGDLFNFVEQVEGFNFPEALKFVAERNGIPMPQRNEFSDPNSRLRGALEAMHEIAAQLYQEMLHGPQGAEARAYLERRKLSPDPQLSSELIATFEIGFSDPQGQALTRKLTEERFTAEQMDASGLVRKRSEGGGYFDSFRGRLMFPIHNEAGKVIAFGGRAMGANEQPKYLNSPETVLYKKTSTLYNLHRARDGMRKANRTVLVEGYMDAIGVHAAGVREVVASCGTALTNAQVRAIHRHSDTVIVSYDFDAAGADAGEKAIQLLLDEGVHVKMLERLKTEDGLDPDEFVKQKGVEAYRAKLDGASGYFHWLADRARTKFDMRSTDGRMDAFKFLLPSVQKIPDKLERAAVANDLAGYLGVDPALVREQFRRAQNAVGTGSRPPARPLPNGAANGPTPQEKISIPPLERILIQALLASDLTRQEILPRLTPEMTAAFVAHEIVEVLQDLAREQENQGSSATFAEVDTRIQEPAKTLLHDIGTADEIGDDEACLLQARACLERLAEDFRKRQIDRLRAQVKQAERDGNLDEVMGLLGELDRLKQHRAGENT